MINTKRKLLAINYFKYDCKRICKKEKSIIKKLLLIQFHPGLVYLKWFRRASSAKNRLFKFICRLKLHQLSIKYGIQIPVGTEIGPGFYIGHFGNIVINPNAKIGKNCNIAQGVTIGQSNRGKRKGFPIIGNKVWIGPNAVIVGKIRIGDNVLIAPGAFVNMDVPDNSIVIGNPAEIKPSENATDGYINNCIE